VLVHRDAADLVEVDPESAREARAHGAAHRRVENVDLQAPTIGELHLELVAVREEEPRLRLDNDPCPIEIGLARRKLGYSRPKRQDPEVVRERAKKPCLATGLPELADHRD